MDNGALLSVVAVVIAVISLAGVIFLYRLSCGALATRADAKKEEMLKAQVREKAKASENSDGEVTENLTDSGIFSVMQMMDALISGGNFEEAEKWALNAIQNHPNRVDVPLKLAEIYHQTGRKNAFVAIVNNLMRKRLDIPQDAQRRLMTMGREIAPGDPVFSDSAAQPMPGTLPINRAAS